MDHKSPLQNCHLFFLHDLNSLCLLFMTMKCKCIHYRIVLGSPCSIDPHVFLSPIYLIPGADPGGGPGGPGPPLTLGFEAPKLSIFGPYLIFP